MSVSELDNEGMGLEESSDEERRDKGKCKVKAQTPCDPNLVSLMEMMQGMLGNLQMLVTGQTGLNERLDNLSIQQNSPSTQQGVLSSQQSNLSTQQNFFTTKYLNKEPVGLDDRTGWVITETARGGRTICCRDFEPMPMD